MCPLASLLPLIPTTNCAGADTTQNWNRCAESLPRGKEHPGTQCSTQLSETLSAKCPMPQGVLGTQVWLFWGIFWDGGGRISLRCSFSSAAQKHFSERRARSADWQFPSLCLQPWINKGNHKQVRRHWRHFQWSTDTLSHTLTCLPFQQHALSEKLFSPTWQHRLLPTAPWTTLPEQTHCKAVVCLQQASAHIHQGHGKATH